LAGTTNLLNRIYFTRPGDYFEQWRWLFTFFKPISSTRNEGMIYATFAGKLLPLYQYQYTNKNDRSNCSLTISNAQQPVLIHAFI
jgi:hypothetical protein